MFGGEKKTLGDLMEWEPSSEKSEDPQDEGPGPAKLQMKKLANQLGIEDLDAFAELVGLVVERC